MTTNNLVARYRPIAFLALIAVLLFSVVFLTEFYSNAQKLGVASESGADFAPAAATITGRVFQDYNGNGTFDTAGSAALPAIDAGINGVTVTAYDAAGLARGSATTVQCTGVNTPVTGCLSVTDRGWYSLAATGTGPYRLEFTTLPGGYTPSARSKDSVLGGTISNAGSTVQFVNNINTSNVNLAVNVGEDYCQNNPMLCSAIERPGNQTGSRSTTFTIPYNAPTVNTYLANTSQTGAVYGTAYQPTTGTVFQSAYMKRHAGFGPLGTGGIYRINPGTSSVGNYVDVQTIGLNTGTDPRVTAGYVLPATGATPHWDYAAYTEVGKRSIGGLDYDAGRNTLWFINLADRRLHGIKNVNPGVTPVNADLVRDSSNILGFAVNTSPAITCTNGVLRPWGIKIYRGFVYVGAVCTGENAGATAANLFAYVLKLDPSNPAAGFTQVVSQQLNYARNEINFGTNQPWQPWINSESSRTIAGGAVPQPIVSGIEIDKDGSIIMGLRDRWGDQYAVSQYRPDTTQANTTLATEIYGFGDILRFCNSGGTFSNPGTAGCPNNARPAGETVSANQGPGAGEFYVGDYGPGSPDDFSEITHGALAMLPGSDRVVSTVHDPGSFFSGGFIWLSNTNGLKLSAYDAFVGSTLNSTNDFNKGNGLGDVEILCDAAPIEIGNRVWRDSNSNGVQDPGENGIAGVTVRLYQGLTLVGTAVTDANGEYYFVSSAIPDPNTTDNIGQVNGGILYNTAYQIRFDLAANYAGGGPLFGLSLAPFHQTTQQGSVTSSDSDTIYVANPPGSPGGTWPVISLTTGGPGANDHTFDAGFILRPTAADVSVQGRILLQAGYGIRNATVALTEANGTVHFARTGSFGYYRFDNIPGGQSVIVSVSSKRYTFSQPTRPVSLNDDLSGVDFIADQ